MDSSDSEDDCYGNIAQKLQRMKNKYCEDKIESTNLLNESTDVDEKGNKSEKPKENTSKKSPERKNSGNSSDIDDTDSITIDSILAMSSKRITRSTMKRANTEMVAPEGSAPKRTNKRKKKSETSNLPPNITTDNTSLSQNTTSSAENRQANSRTRGGRGRGRGRRNRGRSSIQSFINQNIPTYSVGNTEEYYDQSDNQQLFSTKKPTNDVVVVEDSETLDENEELSVKVYWQSSEFFKFTIRRFQKLVQIFEYFSKKENVSNDKLFFTFNDRILKPDDTPDSINYSIVKFIDGGIVNQSISSLITKDTNNDRNGIKLKFQCQNVKKPFETTISFDEKLSLAMMKCAEHFEIAIDKLKFQFDGDAITGKCTAKDLELEGGECIDVVIIR